jgi:hypothetical protein
MYVRPDSGLLTAGRTRTAQMCAAVQGHWDVCQMLLDNYGATVSVIDTATGKSLLHWFVQHGNYEAKQPDPHMIPLDSYPQCKGCL